MSRNKPPFSVLVVEDDRATRRQLEFLLTNAGFKVESAADGSEALAKLRRRWYPIVLTDWSMPEMEGPALCRALREESSARYSYVVLLTGRSESEHVQAGLEAGADDYVTKPFDRAELLARLRVGRRIVELQERMRRTEQRLREMVDRDGLTGVLNRRALDRRLAEAFEFASRHDRPLSIAMLDVDHFKRVNDDHGHLVGDAVLREVARRIEHDVRSYDVLGRYGGEEFLLILPETVAWSARIVLERIRSAVAASPIVYESHQVPVTISSGLVTIDSSYRGTIEMAIEAADSALYEAKRAGRDRVVSVSVCAQGKLESQPPTKEIPDLRLGAA